MSAGESDQRTPQKASTPAGRSKQPLYIRLESDSVPCFNTPVVCCLMHLPTVEGDLVSAQVQI